MKKTLSASWRFLALGLPVLMVSPGVGAGLVEQARALPLEVERAGCVLLGAADLLGDGLEAGRLFDEEDQLRRLQDPLAPEVRPAVRFEQRRRRRQLGVMVEALADNVERGARPFEVV